ncbi:MAG: hypothetical protein C0432_01885 [Candidatus Puniceispirillum sp.]|nr:hypothetical protein [Candidatus Pelagibacter sp.]MBA4283026.1 hypothetical protein [Candidatus Puniceispirillum sp.]
MNFENAIQIYIQWKKQLQNCIHHKTIGNLDANHICQDNLCELGEWLYGDHPEKISKDTVFKEIKEKHKRFHEITGKILKRIENNEALDPNKELGIESEYGKVSSKLIALLMRMRVKTSS